MNRPLALAVMLALFAMGARPSSVIPGLAGVYKHRFMNGTVDGDRFVSENVLEVVPAGPRAAYVRARLAFYNGHSCGIYGIAHEEQGALVYRTKNPDASGPPMCVLRLDRIGREVRLSDGEGSCHAFCGMRGSLSDARFPAASRRTIHYMPRLKASREYREALEQERHASR